MCVRNLISHKNVSNFNKFPLNDFSDTEKQLFPTFEAGRTSNLLFLYF